VLEGESIALAQIVVHDFTGREEVGEIPEEEAPPLSFSFEFAHYKHHSCGSDRDIRRDDDGRKYTFF
jgi:hypothetical protein